jgi:type IX secretion system PorP/SprF family membrane protein
MADEYTSNSNQVLKIPISYPIKIKGTNLAIALSPGLMRRNFMGFQSVKFDMDAGLFWYGEQFYLGYSASHVTTPFYQSSGYQTAAHHYLQSGYKFRLGPHHLFPMINFKTDGASFLLEAMTYFQFKNDLFSIGLGYRARSSLMIGASVQLKKFRIGYNYDHFISSLNNANLNAHELRLIFAMRKDKVIFSPSPGNGK